jgi:hypothetical protein
MKRFILCSTHNDIQYVEEDHKLLSSIGYDAVYQIRSSVEPFVTKCCNAIWDSLPEVGPMEYYIDKEFDTRSRLYTKGIGLKGIIAYMPTYEEDTKGDPIIPEDCISGRLYSVIIRPQDKSLSTGIPVDCEVDGYIITFENSYAVGMCDNDDTNLKDAVNKFILRYNAHFRRK